jgi:hypothetical protein
MELIQIRRRRHQHGDATIVSFLFCLSFFFCGLGGGGVDGLAAPPQQQQQQQLPQHNRCIPSRPERLQQQQQRSLLFGRPVPPQTQTRRTGSAAAATAMTGASWRTPPLFGTIYYPDGSASSEGSSDHDNGNSEGEDVPAPLKCPTTAPLLARLVATHAPEQMGLALERINQVSVRSVQPSSVDIEALVCEDDGCVSVSVPVQLPNPCYRPTTGGSSSSSSFDGLSSTDGGELFDSCILENLHALDQLQSAAAAGGGAVRLSPEEMARAERLHDELHSPEVAELPRWWIPCTDLALSRQCESLRDLLNEPDFRHELRTMVIRQVGAGGDDNSDDDDLKVGHAACVAIGTAGMVVRATAMSRGGDGGGASSTGNRVLGMFEVPVAFPTPAVEFDTIRNHVLDIVEGV